jgi:hypothetical protein
MDSFIVSCALSDKHPPAIPSQQLCFIFSSIQFAMPSSWSQPFADILKENASLWTEAKTKKQRQSAIETVANKIMDKINKDGDDPIEKLQKVSFYCTFCQFVLLTFFRKFSIGITTIEWRRRRRRTTSWPPNIMQRGLSRQGMSLRSLTGRRSTPS